MNTPPKKDAARDAQAAASAAELVISHLLRECHVQTAAALLEEGEKLASTESARSRLATLRKAANARGLVAGAMARAKVREQVRGGEIEPALRAADKILGAPLQKRSPSLHLDLCCQLYVELVRAKRVNDALEFSQNVLKPRLQGEDLSQSHEDVISIIAYLHPEESPLSHVLDERRRWVLADRLSGELFAAQFEGFAVGAPHRSALESAVRQNKLVCKSLDSFHTDSVVSDGLDKDLADDDDDDDLSSEAARTNPPPRTQVEDAEVVDMNDD